MTYSLSGICNLHRRISNTRIDSNAYKKKTGDTVDIEGRLQRYPPLGSVGKHIHDSKSTRYSLELVTCPK